MYFCILFLWSHLTASVLFIRWGNGNFNALIKVSTEILIICLVKINKILCAFSWRCAYSLCFEKNSSIQRNVWELVCRRFQHSTAKHTDSLTHASARLFIFSIRFNARLEERRSPPELRHASELVFYNAFNIFNFHAGNWRPHIFSGKWKINSGAANFELFVACCHALKDI